MAGSIGVDEAGRGPVLGSMYVAGVAVPDEAILPDGVKDSKRLPADRRETLAVAIEEHDQIRSAIIEVSVDRIDDAPGELNRLTASATARAIDGLLERGVTGERIVVDACDTDADRYASRVTDGLDENVSVTARHGADGAHPVVAAASILAKQRREEHVSRLRDHYGDIGSGYPSDPRTRAYLAEYVDEHERLPACARRSWQTCADVLAARTQGRLTDF